MHINIVRTYLQLRRSLISGALHAFALTIFLFLCLTIVSVDGAAQQTSGTASQPATPQVTLTEQDAGKSVDVSVGEKIVVQLPSNPTTGYQWSVLGDPAPLKFVKSEYAADAQTAGRVGAGGMQTLKFTAKSLGKVELKLGYRRPWEKDVAPAKTFAATVVVK
jgi:inhibitor of cysteine peptidase